MWLKTILACFGLLFTLGTRGGVYAGTVKITGNGAVYVLKQPCVKALHFFWDRKHDNKLYFRAPPNVKAIKKDTICEYSVKLAGFESQEDTWKEEAAAAAKKIKGEINN